MLAAARAQAESRPQRGGVRGHQAAHRRRARARGGRHRARTRAGGSSHAADRAPARRRSSCDGRHAECRALPRGSEGGGRAAAGTRAAEAAQTRTAAQQRVATACAPSAELESAADARERPRGGRARDRRGMRTDERELAAGAPRGARQRLARRPRTQASGASRRRRARRPARSPARRTWSPARSSARAPRSRATCASSPTSLRNNAERLLRDVRLAHGGMTARLDQAAGGTRRPSRKPDPAPARAASREEDGPGEELDVPEFVPRR